MDLCTTIRTAITLRDHGYGASASRGVPVYTVVQRIVQYKTSRPMLFIVVSTLLRSQSVVMYAVR